jgi:hypothetical protein
MYRDGWRTIPEIVADGAGSGIHGIQRGPTRCIIRWEQPTYIDDLGRLVESESFTMSIQCSVEDGRSHSPGDRVRGRASGS